MREGSSKKGQRKQEFECNKDDKTPEETSKFMNINSEF